MRHQVIFSIYESEDRYIQEFLSVDTGTNIPYYQRLDGGNMWGNKMIEITWEKVASYSPAQFKGINEHNWKEYI